MNKIFRLIIMCILLGNLITMSITFFKAYSTEDKEILVTINKYNEAWYEAILFPIFLCLGILLIYDEFQEFKKEYEQT